MTAAFAPLSRISPCGCQAAFSKKSKNKKATKTHGYNIRNTFVAYRVILIRFDNFVKRIFQKNGPAAAARAQLFG